jgi:hypothetical protein
MLLGPARVAGSDLGGVGQLGRINPVTSDLQQQVIGLDS